jgi:foldase protein PrsA
MNRKYLSFLLFIWLVGAGYCEDVSVVMVGNRVVLESEVRAKMREENKDYEEALRSLVSERLLLLQVEKEGIEVTIEEIDSEINRIMERFPDEKTFLLQLEKEDIPYYLFRKNIEERIKVRKLIRKNVASRFEITPLEISKKMKEIEETGSYSYNLKMKWFNEESSSEDFVKNFDETKEKEMTDAGWMNTEEILPDVLEGMKKMDKGDLSSPIKVNNRYLVLLLKDVRKQEVDTYILYNRAKEVLYSKKFSEEFDRYLKEIQAKTPMYYSD